MPLYEYKCKDCENIEVLFHKYTTKTLIECRNCGQEKSERQISTANFQFKGEGFYATDKSRMKK